MIEEKYKLWREMDIKKFYEQGRDLALTGNPTLFEIYRIMKTKKIDQGWLPFSEGYQIGMKMRERTKKLIQKV